MSETNRRKMYEQCLKGYGEMPPSLEYEFGTKEEPEPIKLEPKKKKKVKK